MKMIERENIIRVFEDYVANYNAKDGKIKLKIDHILRVADISEQIAKALFLSKEDTDLAWLIGMLHDIGRFEQIKQFQTFVDALSVNHALYGVKVLFEEGHIRDYIETDAYDQIISDAILYHNVFRIPADLDKRTLLFCKIIRDADKIDILKVTMETPMETIYGIGEEQMKQLTLTKEVIEAHFQESAIEHRLKKTHLDEYIGHGSLVFELEFPISYQIVKNQGFIDQLFTFRTFDEDTNQHILEMGKYLDAYIEKKIG